MAEDKSDVDTRSASELAQYDQALAEKGHLVLIQHYQQIGDSYEPINQGQIPEGYLSFTLTPRRGTSRVAHVLVLDPKRVDYKIIEMQHEFREPEGKAEDEKQREKLRGEGYELILTQFPEERSDPLKLVAVRTKIPEVFANALE